MTGPRALGPGTSSGPLREHRGRPGCPAHGGSADAGRQRAPLPQPRTREPEAQGSLVRITDRDVRRGPTGVSTRSDACSPGDPETEGSPGSGKEEGRQPGAWRAEPAPGVRVESGLWPQGGTEQGKPAGAGHCSGGPVPAQPVRTRCSRQTVQDTCGPGAGGRPGCGRIPSHRGCSQRWPPPASDAGVSLRNLPGAGAGAGAQTGQQAPAEAGGRSTPAGSPWQQRH